LRATFQTIIAGNNTTDGQVNLTLDTSHLASGEYVSGWGFNINPSFPGFPGSLSIVRNGGTAPTSATPSISFAEDVSHISSSTKAGLFDLVFGFPAAQGDRFQFADTMIFKITGKNLTADAFEFVSSKDGNNPGGWASAADIRGFLNPAGGSGSGSIGTAIPEPSAIALALSGLIPVSLMVWRRRARS
jgi:hypothetical protein